MKKTIIIMAVVAVMALSSCVTAPTKHQVGMAFIEIGTTAIGLHRFGLF